MGSPQFSTSTGSDEGDELLRLASADNFRDVAGTGEGYATATGRMRRGVFFRSSQLTLTPEDVSLISGLELTVIHDLRPLKEVQRYPDVPVAGAEWHHHPVPGMPMDAVSGSMDPAFTHALMCDTYRALVTSATSRATLGQLLAEMAVTPGPQLFHCVSGKDRTGWVAMLLQHIAGVSLDTMMADYLLSNELAAVSRRVTEAFIQAQYGAERVAVYEPALIAHRDFLEAGLDQVARSYGDLDGYLGDGLALSPALRTTLAGRLA
jgi:protein tyrosine/serine phosphatase